MDEQPGLSRRRFLGYGMGTLLGRDLSRVFAPPWTGGWARPLAAQSDPTTERRREYLAILRRVFQPSQAEPDGREGRISSTAESWEDWVDQTGELPPDFLNMPSLPFLPDPLVGQGGVGRIETIEQWERQKEWIRREYEHWILGSFPPRPENLEATVNGTRQNGETTVHDVVLRFGPGMRGRLRLDVVIPNGPAPFPVFLTNHGLQAREWVNLAVRRGYLGCVIKVGDPVRFDGDDSDSWIELYPEHDFSGMSRWAWAGMRAVDYLLTLPYVDPERIAISGNSRYAKSSLIAAAFDERISAVIPSRGNGGCGIPWRHTTGMFVNEGLEEITRRHRHWFHPRLRFFSGREDKLPVDQNMLLSLVAPRGLLMSHAYTEHQGNPWAIEQAYRSVRSVYRFLGAEEKVGLLQRPGEHTVRAGVVELYLDFLDGVFDRGSFVRPEVFVNNYTFEDRGPDARSLDRPRLPEHQGWKSDLTNGVAWSTVKSRTRRKVEWVLGDEPPVPAPLAVADSVVRYRSSDRPRSTVYPGTLFDRPLENDGMGVTSLRYGDGLRADVYYRSRYRPGGTKGASSVEGEPRRGDLPTVLWLHPYAYAIGYSRYTRRPFNTLVRSGFAVVGVDLIGHGTRVEEIKEFYRRYPRHSLMGRMVVDMSALITAMSDLSLVNSNQVYVIGSGLGAKVALFLAALDERVRGVASVCGFASLRDRAAQDGTEGLYHYSHLHGILPRLGEFVDRPESVPIDYDDLLSLIAPRPTLIIAPTLDRYHPVESVRTVVEKARAAFQVYGKSAALELETPEGFNGFELEEWSRQARIIEWLKGQARR